MEENIQEKQNQAIVKKEKGNNPNLIAMVLGFLLRLFNSTIYYFFFVGLFLFLALQLPFIQQFIGKKSAQFLSEEWGTKVSVERFRCNLLNPYSLDHVLVLDQELDTLLYAEKISVNWRLNPFSVLQNKFNIKDVTIDSAVINVHRYLNKKTNLDFIVNKYKTDSGADTKLTLSLESVNLFLVNIKFQNDPNHEVLVARMPEVRAVVDNIDPGKSIFKIRQFVLGNLDFSIKRYPNELTPKIPKSILALETPIVKRKKYPKKKEEPYFSIADFRLKDAKFRLADFRGKPKQEWKPGVMNYQHLVVSRINWNVRDWEFDEGIFEWKMDDFSASERSGFELKKFSSEKVRVSSKGLDIINCKINTPGSEIGDTLRLEYNQYGDFLSFNDNVRMVGGIHNSRILLSDIMIFAPKLYENKFFVKNKSAILELNGSVFGKVNTLKARNVFIRLRDKVLVQGNFDSQDIAIRDSEMVNVRLKKLQTSFVTLRELIPDFSAPKEFDRLGKIDFSGNFDGFFYDFVANGTLVSELGKAEGDARIDLKPGNDKAIYSGSLMLDNFQLGKFLNDSKFGVVTGKAQVENGVGMRLNTLNAKLKADVSRFDFKGYTYSNGKLNGTLNKRMFDGDFVIKDNNVDLNFKGLVNFKDSIPVLKFKTEVNKLDLFTSKLFDKDIVFSGTGDFDIIFESARNFQGTVKLENFNFIHNKTKRVNLKDLFLNAEKFADGQNQIFVKSNVINGSIKGIFDPTHFPSDVFHILDKLHPGYSKQFFPKRNIEDIKKDSAIASKHRYDFNLALNDFQPFAEMILSDVDTLISLRAKGNLNGMMNTAYFEGEMEKFKIGNLKLLETVVVLDSDRARTQFDLNVFKSFVGDLEFAPICLLGTGFKDSVDLNFTASNLTNVLDNLNINAALTAVDSSYLLKFLPSNLVILKEKWAIGENNFLRIRNNAIETKNFDLRSGKKRIAVETYGKKGISLVLRNFGFDLLNPVIKNKKMKFSGPFTVFADVENVFDLKNLSILLESDSLMINEDRWGKLRVDGEMVDTKSPVKGKVALKNGDEELRLDGVYNFPKSKTKGDNGSVIANLTLDEYPLSILEYFIDGISNTRGSISGDVAIKNNPLKPDVSGEFFVNQGEVMVNYLNAYCKFPKEKLILTNKAFDATGSTVEDVDGNKATVKGGLRHNHLLDWTMDLSLEADKFVALNTNANSKNPYYGYGVGKAKIKFSGPFSRPDIDINATTLAGTKMYIPINTSINVNDVRFINLRPKNRNTDSLDLATKGYLDQSKLKGVNLSLTLNMTEDAEVNILVDPVAGDNIKGTGNGNLRIKVGREGGLSIDGTYTIRQGKYLFTLLNVVRKEFAIKSGGTISWTGDPLKANIDILADYEGLNASIYPLIQNEILALGSTALDTEAKRPSKVNLGMHLTGPLLKPNIDFDLDFPTLPNDLRTLTNNSISTLKANPAELNRQVFGLLVVGAFMPGNNAFLQAGAVGSTTLNTISQLITSQLSSYLRNLLAEVVDGKGVINTVDFNISSSSIQTFGGVQGAGNAGAAGTELTLRPRFELFNSRLAVEGGSNLNVGNAVLVDGITPVQRSFSTGDVSIEYKIKGDELKLRLYYNTRPFLDSRLQGGGVAFSYRKEYDSFDLFVSELRNDVKNWFK
jgi:hypothetical protein